LKDLGVDGKITEIILNKRNVGVESIRLAQDRVQWRASRTQ